MPGPRKKLAALDALDGNPSGRKYEVSGIEAYGEPFISDHLPDVAQRAMDMITSSMPPGIYCKLDTYALQAYCVAVARHEHATTVVFDAEFAWVVEDEEGKTKASPWLTILDKASADMARWSSRLGLTPKDREELLQRLKIPKGQRKSKFGALLVQTPRDRDSIGSSEQSAS